MRVFPLLAFQGFGLTFGDDYNISNSVVGVGDFFFDPDNNKDSPMKIGWSYASFIFQMSFATTTSTIVSGLCPCLLLGVAMTASSSLQQAWPRGSVSRRTS